MGWALASDPGLRRLTQYESLCTGFFNANPASAICQYDRSRFDDGLLFDIISEHPLLIIAGSVCRNPYYVPSASFAERERGDADLDKLLGNVLARERQERWLAVAEVGLEVHELQEVVGGEVTGRGSDEDIIVFKSNGLAAWDIAVAAAAVERARVAGAGREVA